MFINGKYTSAEILIKDIDFKENFAGINQVKALCDLKILEDSIIKIMPDMCPAIGTTIGSTFTYTNKIIPSLVSGDIGCGITVIKLKDKNIELAKLDRVIREELVEKQKIENISNKFINKIDLSTLKCKKHVDINRCYSKLGELGGGNHFLEIDKDEFGYLYLVIHSGSRLLGQQIYDYYMNEGYLAINDKSYNRLYTYLEDKLMEDYLFDSKMAVQFASLNRAMIIEIILKFMKLKEVSRIESIHNYIDTDNKIIRKGAISANKNQPLVIPISSSSIYGGVILGTGLGNKNWNYSAPHGAGRICSRAESKDMFSFNEYKKNMEGVFSSCIKKETIDESPMVYKKIDFIKENIKDSVNIDRIIKPIFNYKSKE